MSRERSYYKYPRQLGIFNDFMLKVKKHILGLGELPTKEECQAVEEAIFPFIDVRQDTPPDLRVHRHWGGRD